MTTTTYRSVTVCADDFGLSEAIDDGILLLAQMGRVNAVSMMVVGPSFERNAARLRACAVQTGLHLDLTETARVFRMPLRELIARAYLRRLDMQALSQEIEAQLDGFEAVMHRAPHYVDGHQHVHQLPGVRELLVRSLQARYGLNLPWIRSTRVGTTAELPVKDHIKARIVEALGARKLKRLCEDAGIQTNNAFHGVYSFACGRAPYATMLRTWLHNAAHGDLIMCHPALAQCTDSGDVIALDRTVELDVLRSPDMAMWMRQTRIRIHPSDANLPNHPSSSQPTLAG